MTLRFADVKTQYEKDHHLKEKEVKKVMDWVKHQPHLPKINELQAILFLHACCYNEDAAKKTIDTYFSMKTLHSHLFKMRIPHISPIKESLDVTLLSVLPKKTPENYTIILIKLMDVNPRNLHLVTQMKLFDMVTMLHVHRYGISDGYVTVLDLKGVVFRHLLRVSPFALRTFLQYVAEGIPARVKGFHFVNTVPFMDKILTFIKPLMIKELYDIIYVHNTIDDLLKYIPLECLPKDYGGSVEPVSVLHDKSKRNVLENQDFFEWEDKQIVDESKRPGRRSCWFNWH